MIGKTSAGTSAKEEKTVTAGTAQKVVTPSNGKLLSKVTINPTPSQAKTATPTAAQQTIKPDSGKLLSQVLVNAVPDNEKKGLYVWKKCNPSISLSLTLATSSVNPSLVTVESSDVDVSNIDESFFYGLKGTGTDAIGPYAYTFEFSSNNTVKFDSSSGSTYKGTFSYTYNKGTHQLSIATSLGSPFSFNALSTKKTFLEFVVADNTNAYPDGGTQGGYWYEKVVEGVDLSAFGITKVAVDEIVPTSNISSSADITHSLGDTPKYLIITTDETISSSTTAGYVKEYFATQNIMMSFYFTYAYSNGTTVTGASALSSTSFKLNNGGSLKSGVTYKILTMA